MKHIARSCLLVLAIGCSGSPADADAIRIGESTASARQKLSAWQARSASERFAWSQGTPVDELTPGHLDQFKSKCRAENSFYDDPIFAWQTGERECVICFTAKNEVITALSQVKPHGDWQHGLTAVLRDGQVK